MRLNERHAAIAILFLVAVLLVGFFWQDDSAGPEPAGPDQDLARHEESTGVPGQVHAAERTDQRNERAGVPLGGFDHQPGTVETVTTRGQQGENHSVEPGARPLLGNEGPTVDLTPTFDTRPPAGGSSGLIPQGGAARGSATESGIAELDQLATDTVDGSGFLRDDGRRPARDEAETSVDVADDRRAERASREVPVTSPAAGATPSARREYTVRSGDALSLIASRQCGSSSQSTVDAICVLNGLSDPNMIREGMVLKLPARTTSSAASSTRTAAAAAPVATGGRKTVTIRSGEMLSNVLVRELGTYKRSIAAVQRLNPGLNPDRVDAGQKILLPLPAELLPAPEGTRTRPRAGAAEAPRLASSSNRATRSEFVVR